MKYNLQLFYTRISKKVQKKFDIEGSRSAMPDRNNIKVKVIIEGEYKAKVEDIVTIISGIDYGDIVSDGITSINIDIDVLDPVHEGD